MGKGMLRLAGEIELQRLCSREGYRSPGIKPAPQAQYGRRGEMIDTRPYESEVLKACLGGLLLHPSVEWFSRMNTGAVDYDGQYVKFGFTGLGDILGQLKFKFGGRTLAIECKRPGEQPTDDQAEFLFKVWNAGGCAFVATSVDDVFRNIPR
jgi:hypothetical protein